MLYTIISFDDIFYNADNIINSGEDSFFSTDPYYYLKKV